MDRETAKPRTGMVGTQASVTQARASVDAHLHGRMPSYQQTSASLHARMAQAPARRPGPAPSDSSAVAGGGFLRPNPIPQGPASPQNSDPQEKESQSERERGDSGGTDRDQRIEQNLIESGQTSGVTQATRTLTTPGSMQSNPSASKEAGQRRSPNTPQSTTPSAPFSASTIYPGSLPSSSGRSGRSGRSVHPGRLETGVDAQAPSHSTCPSSVCVPAKSHVGPCKNPQCAACGTVIIPSPKATYPIQERPSITVGDWSIFTTKGPICSSDELDHLNDTRYDFPLPEMIFGNNCVRLYHETTGAFIEFNTLDALDSLASHADYKVAYYKEWLSSRPKAEQKEQASDSKATAAEGRREKVEQKEQASASKAPAAEGRREKAEQKESASASKAAAAEGCREKDMRECRESTDRGDSPPLESVRPYDWTYSTNYTGTVHQMHFVKAEGQIPLEKLVRQDPILFFDESILFEDELGDNGISMYSAKVRVMESCLLLLGRFSMRIDDVAFRIRDTRVYIDFETGLIMREYKCQEASYDDLLRKANGRSSDPKKLLRDSNWVSSNTPVVSRSVETAEVVHGKP